MHTESGFVLFQRSDGSQVAGQISNIIYAAKGDHGAVLNFGGGIQVNVREDFEAALEKIRHDPVGAITR